jgi:hypothetical protein
MRSVPMQSLKVSKRHWNFFKVFEYQYQMPISPMKIKERLDDYRDTFLDLSMDGLKCGLLKLLHNKRNGL